MKHKVLFVCLGNICRSAAAEAVLKHYLQETGQSGSFHVDSAGTAGYHEGCPADGRMIRIAGKRGYAVDSIARRISRRDLDSFDLVLAMDRENYRDVLALCSTDAQREKVRPFMEFVPVADKEKFRVDAVPDPYYGGERDFNKVLDILETAMPQIAAWFSNGNPAG